MGLGFISKRLAILRDLQYSTPNPNLDVELRPATLQAHVLYHRLGL